MISRQIRVVQRNHYIGNSYTDSVGNFEKTYTIITTPYKEKQPHEKKCLTIHFPKIYKRKTLPTRFVLFRLSWSLRQATENLIPKNSIFYSLSYIPYQKSSFFNPPWGLSETSEASEQERAKRVEYRDTYSFARFARSF